MDYALYAAASGMAAQQRSLEAVAQNLSNTSTTGYQPVRAVFSDLYARQMQPAVAGASDATGLGVQTLGLVREWGRGTLQVTGSPYDLALSGDGMFRLRRDDGSEVYTRAGHFHADGRGQLRSPEGYQLLGANGPLTVPAHTERISVGNDGAVVANVAGGKSVPVGRLSLASFNDPGALAPAGNGVFAAAAAAGRPQIGAPTQRGLARVVQGSLEDSGVDLTREMTSLLEAQRLYELNSRALQAADQMHQLANNIRR